jgi:hypothetical protein
MAAIAGALQASVATVAAASRVSRVCMVSPVRKWF